MAFGVHWRGKLRRRFGLLAALLFVASVAGAWVLTELRRRSEAAVGAVEAPLVALAEAERHALETALAVQTLRTVLPGSPSPYVRQEIAEHWRATREAWQRAQRARVEARRWTAWAAADSEGVDLDEATRVAEATAALDTFEAAVGQLLAAPSPPAAERLWTDAQALVLRLDALRQAWAPAARAVREAVEHRLTETPLFLAAGGVGLAALALVFGAFLASALEARAADLARAAQAWAAGTPVPFDDGPKDEFAPLAAALNTVQLQQAAREQALRAELEAARAEAERARKAAAQTTRFVSEVSHELRIPLTSILGFAELLAEDWDWLVEEDRRRYVDIIERNARHLLHVVSDLLNLAKADAGMLEVSLGAVEVREVVEAAVTSLRPRAAAQGVALEVRVEGPTVARADWGRLRQVVLNLLDNAIKYSPPGGRVEVRLRGGPDRVVLEVVDQGPGIPPELQDRLFRPFSRLHPGGRQLPGAGLGLALVRRLVDLMGGRVGVRSAPGQGSAFWVELDSGLGLPPAPRPDRERAIPPSTHPGATVAVVDDDPDLRTFAVQVLRHAGLQVVTDSAEDRDGLVARLAAAHPDVVLLDLRLGGIEGAEILAALRRHPGLRHVPILAFTAALTDGERHTLLAAGFDGLLPKPIAPAALVRAIDSVLRACPRPPSPSPSTPSATAEAPVADDPFAAIRAKFVAGLADRAAALQAAAQNEDRAALARELHKLKGAAASFGEAALAQAAAAAEAALNAADADWRAPLAHALLEIERVRRGEPAHPPTAPTDAPSPHSR
jgi:signal transduction histidine kinase/DNA-binding response OmpR family regulator